MNTADDSPDTDATAGTAPLLRVVRGQPDETELAALTAVVASMAAAGSAGNDETPTRSRWADREALAGAPLTPGPGSWWASGLRRR